MKPILIISALLMITTISINAQSKSQIKSKGIKSKIVWKYDYKTGKELKVKESEKKYDTKGNIITEIEYDDYGKLSKKTKYTYNENNDIVKEVYYSSNGKIKKTIKIKYEGKLKVEKKVFDANDKLKSKKVYQYIK